MKLLGRSPNGRMIKVGNDVKDAKWYNVSDSDKPTIASIKDGEEITVAYEQRGGAYAITFIEKCNVEIGQKVTQMVQKEASTPQPTAVTQKTYGKTPEEQSAIKRQAIGYMTAETLKSYQVQFTDINDLLKIVETIYKKYQELVG